MKASALASLLALFTLILTANATDCFKVGNMAIDLRNRMQKINKIEGDFVTYGNYSDRIDRLGCEVENIGDLKVGVVVLDPLNRIRTIRKVFSNNMVNYKEYSSDAVRHDDYVAHADKIAYEIAVPSTWKNNFFIATDGFEVGKPSRLFSNQNVQFKTLSGSTFVTNIKDLHKEVIEYKVNDMVSFKVGDKIVDSRNSKGVIYKIFENGTVLYKIDGKQILRSAKLFAIATTEKLDMLNWLSRIARSKDEYYSEISVSYDLVVKQEQLQNAKKLLITHLLENKELLSSHLTKEDQHFVLLILRGKNPNERSLTKKCTASFFRRSKKCNLNVSHEEHITRIELVKEHSKRKCIKGKTFGTKSNGGALITPSGKVVFNGFVRIYRVLWVKKGCKGTFKLTIENMNKYSSYGKMNRLPFSSL